MFEASVVFLDTVDALTKARGFLNVYAISSFGVTNRRIPNYP